MSFLKLPKSPESSTNSEQKTTLLALDIGSSFVKCALAKPINPQKPDKTIKFKKTLSSGKLQVLGFSRAPQLPGNMKDGRIANIPGVVSVCEKALADLEKQTGERAKSVVVSISGELVKSKTSTIRYRRDAPNKPVTETELRELLDKIEKRNLDKFKAELSLETDNEDIKLSLINSAVVSISIDGYRINNPVGFKGAEVIVEYYTAFAPSVATSAIEKLCAELELELLTVVVSPFATCRACLGDDVDVDFSAVIIDIGANSTGIAVVDSGDICGTKMFNIGGNAFTRQISESLQITPKKAEMLKCNLDDTKLSDTIINKATSALNRSFSVWLAGTSLALEEFKNIEPLPQNIFLCGGSANLLPLEETLAVSDWYESLPFLKRPIIHLLDPTELPDFTFSDKPAKMLEDVDSSYINCLGLLRVAVDTLLVSPDKTSIRDRISKLLSH